MTRLTQAKSMDSSDSSSSHMRISDEQYFRSCVGKERHLAQLLGHQNIEECYETAGTLWAGAKALPQWTRDWGACGPLLARYKISLAWDAVPTAGDEDKPPQFVRAGGVPERTGLLRPTVLRAVFRADWPVTEFRLQPGLRVRAPGSLALGGLPIKKGALIAPFFCFQFGLTQLPAVSENRLDTSGSMLG